MYMGQFFKKTTIVCFSLSILLFTVVCTAEDVPSWKLSEIRFIDIPKKPINLLPLSTEIKQEVKAKTESGNDNNVSDGMIQQPQTGGVVTTNPPNSIPETIIPDGKKELKREKAVFLHEKGKYIIHFAYNSSVMLTPGELKNTINTIKDEVIINPNSNISISVTGYTDKIGSSEYNLKLSERRANAVAKSIKNEFKDKNDNYEVKGLGKCCFMSNEEEDRRVEVVLSVEEESELITITPPFFGPEVYRDSGCGCGSGCGKSDQLSEISNTVSTCGSDLLEIIKPKKLEYTMNNIKNKAKTNSDSNTSITNVTK